ncbi:PAS domain S-box protein [Flavobacterium sangjuense]|uniref:Sensor histidine kinase TodS n=1 Tax=Flavobacterium sangjuense TaxID=2518177 RepID=A0A4P7PQA3_9FLAO|nr:PAS domain S-box protein [Flavobacterium sangjuense]QBZ96586.1 Sensor histidine kinase TodS [Flavobacterium sangjuense]
MKFIKDDKPYQIVVIEDNPGDYVLIEDYLQEHFVAQTISWAKNFKEAKSILTDPSFHCDLLLLDLSLPDKNGEELINEMSLLCHEIPLIILTGYSDFNFSLKSLSLGVSDYLIKDELDPHSLYKSIIYNIERKKTLLQLETSERRYSDLFHLSPLPMWVYDIDTLRFLDVNLAAEKHYGYSLQEFLGMTIKDIRPAEDIPELIKRIDLLNAKPGAYSIGNFRHQKKNGEIINVEIQSNVIPFQNTTGRLILANDITERVTYVEAIEKQNEKLKEIAWIQSHVVRAPLARMMSLIDIIKNYGIDDHDGESLLDNLLKSAEELDSIIKDITQKTEGIQLDKNKP